MSFANKTEVKGLRLVSGPSMLRACNDPNDQSRYRDIGDGTVEDVKTGLMWRQCPEGQTGLSCTTAGPIDRTSFGDMKANPAPTLAAYVSALNAAPNTLGLGYADWRIPTVKELASLVDRCTGSSLAINSTLFPNNFSVSYLSATLDANDPERAWYVDFSEGTIAVDQISNTHNKGLRLVRGGQ